MSKTVDKITEPSAIPAEPTAEMHSVYEVLNYNFGPREDIGDLVPPLDIDPLLKELYRIAKKLAARRRQKRVGTS